MKNQNSVMSKNKFYIIMLIVMSVVMLASFLGVTIAYIKGFDKHDDEIETPYLALEYYYNTTKLSSGAITGEIDESGNVTIKVNGTAVDKNSLNISIKNIGNINGKLASVFAYIEIYNSDGTIDNDTDKVNDNGTHYISITPGSDYIVENGMLSADSNKDITLTKNGGISQIIKGIIVDDTITNSNLKGKTFKIMITAEIAQEGYESIDATI